MSNVVPIFSSNHLHAQLLNFCAPYLIEGKRAITTTQVMAETIKAGVIAH